MTPTERAEKIAELFGVEAMKPELHDAIAAQIEEAVSAKEIGMTEQWNRILSRESPIHFARGFAAARDKAAGIVQERIEQNDISANLYTLPENKLARAVNAWMCGVVERIRAMKPDK